MTILLGHPTGSPNAHHAALAHAQAGQLEAFCVSWMPSALTLRGLRLLPGAGPLVRRLARRRFAALADVPKIEGRWREWSRLLRRLSGGDEARLIDDANAWVMRTMRREVSRSQATAVHAYEDCALSPFEAAKAKGKACIYDMPIAYHAEWQRRRAALMRDYADWLPAGAAAAEDSPGLARKQREMQLADLVLVPCQFAEDTVRAACPDKAVACAPYGVDADFWTPAVGAPRRDKLRFIFAGQISLRKGIPGLITAWPRANLADAELELVGPWQLSESARASLPPGIVHRPPCGPAELRARYRAADVVVFPSHFEGFGLALLEGMACGLPALASDASIAPEIVTARSGRVIVAGDTDALVDSLQWFAAHRDDVRAMGQAARAQASLYTWSQYRRLVTQAVAPYV